jgi:signal transduction histidine kinase
MTGGDILLVEDENIVALDMRMRLESMGYRVVDVVDSSAAAVERAAALEPDLVLMDIKLKGDQDGIDAAGLLRERTEVPVIFVTAFTDEHTLERAKRASPYGYIVKPFHERELRIAIELALYKHQYELSIRRARDIAEEANRVKGEFLANMSHELKTPLNSVIGFTELALAAAREAEQREHLAMALSSAKSLLTLIESILDFARMEAGKLSAVAVPFSLDEVIGECADSLAMGAFAKGLDVSIGRDPAVPDSLIGDSSLLKHILLNLLDNAVKFTDRGLIRLGLSLVDQPAYPGSGPTVEFEVSDTGIGMPADKVGLAFARFTQLDPSKTRRAGGTGLGLAIVTKSTELMGGSLSVESEEGKGSKFRLRLPFELGVENGTEEAERGGAGEAFLVGFEGQRLSDSVEVLLRLGYVPKMVGSLGAAVPGTGPVVADEAAVLGQPGETLETLEGRLVVGTRFGGNARSRLEDGSGIAFTPLPLRADGLQSALTELRSRPFPRPKHEAASALASAVAHAEAVPAEGLGRLASLADLLDGAASAGAFDVAERAAKAAQFELASKGDPAGAKLAFSALLGARRADAAAIGEIASRMRSVESGIAVPGGELEEP